MCHCSRNFKVKQVSPILLAALVSVLICFQSAFAKDVSASYPERMQTDALSASTLLSGITEPIEIGVIKMSNRFEDTTVFQETIVRLKKAFFPHEVRVRILDSQTLEKGIVSGEIDAFVASAGYYMRLSRHGAISVGTLISDDAPDPNNGVAGVFLVRKDTDDIVGLEDLQGRSISASFATAFMGFRIGMAEIAVRGFDPEHYFSEIRYVGTADNQAITNALHHKEVDSALITSCWLENQPEEIRNRFRVLNPQNDSMKCVHSTRTYPGITFAVTQGASPGAAHVIARTLLTMPHLKDGYRWGVATDLRAIDRLYKEMKIENYAYLREWSVKRWLQTYWYWLVFVAIIALGLVYHSWRVGILVKKRTAELVKTMEEKRQAQMKADAFREREQKMQKTHFCPK